MEYTNAYINDFNIYWYMLLKILNIDFMIK